MYPNKSIRDMLLHRLYYLGCNCHTAAVARVWSRFFTKLFRTIAALLWYPNRGLNQKFCLGSL